jgi:hypothetical protein
MWDITPSSDIAYDMWLKLYNIFNTCKWEWTTPVHCGTISTRQTVFDEWSWAQTINDIYDYTLCTYEIYITDPLSQNFFAFVSKQCWRLFEMFEALQLPFLNVKGVHTSMFCTWNYNGHKHFITFLTVHNIYMHYNKQVLQSEILILMFQSHLFLLLRDPSQKQEIQPEDIF